MSLQHNAVDIRLNTSITFLKPAIALLNELHDTFNTPFVLAISNSALALITAVQGVRRNKEECIRFFGDIHGILYAIVNLHITSDTGTLPPVILHHLGKFAETLHMVLLFVESRQENRIKHFFRQGEMNTLLKNCRTGLQQALDIFKAWNISIAEMEETTQTMHRQLLELISGLSDGAVSDTLSSLSHGGDGYGQSSDSFSMLPAKPKIFHGRESELGEVVNTLNQDSARIANVGAGGMGKTSLARAVLHRPSIGAKYEHHLFVACDSAASSIEVAAQIGMHVGLKPGNDLTKAVVQYLSRKGPSLLILDNLETSWEPMESRAGVEELLSLLADLPQIALMITMRGAERPAKVRWTRPFMHPLRPLSNDAARQTFIDIADDFHDSEDITQLLSLTDNMPLAVDLIAHLVNYEGCSNVLARWKTERTSLLSDGWDRKSSLDASIDISLSSPRITSCPGALSLLSLLSILPDGLSHAELVQSNLPIPDVLLSRAALLSTSLAYLDDHKRLKSLMPIREHMQHFHPPTAPLIQPLRKHFQLLLDLYQTYQGARQTAGIINEITMNLGNLQHVLRLGLHPDDPDIADTIGCTISFNSFSRITGRGRSALMDEIPAVFPQSSNHRLEAQFITEVFSSMMYHPVPAHFKHLNDKVLESQFHAAVGNYHATKHNTAGAMQALEMALRLSISSGDTLQQATTLLSMARVRSNIGEYQIAQKYAWEAQRCAQGAGSLFPEARSLFSEANCCTSVGDYRNSSLLLRRGRDLLRHCGMSGSNLDHNIMDREADIHLLKSEYAEARSIHTQIVRSTSADEDTYMYALGLLNIAEIDVIIGTNASEINQNLEKARTILSAVTFLRGLIYSDMILADLSLREGNISTAKPLLQKSMDSAWGNSAELVTYGLERLANGSRWGDAPIEWAWPTIYLGYARKTQQRLALHKSLCFLGDLFLATGDEETAQSLFTVALEGFPYMDVHQGRADCMLRIGDIHRKKGDFATAVELWKDARPLFERSLQVKNVTQIDTRLHELRL
ncbi:hypothetical protein DFH09DRAFT_1404462 [Mycena vulgaris]|nr:hypothetical protein DFH09DRAFT_1404462 [Mycena vulgaris]